MEEKNKQLQEFIKQSKKIHNDKYDYSLVKLGCSRTKIKIICPIHGEFEQLPYDHIAKHGCSKCTSSISNIEIEINNFIVSNGLETIQSSRSIISPQELDIYIPSHKLAIEFNGLYWHSEQFLGKDYHIEKTNLCNEKNITLIHIFEDEWLYKQDIVKSRLQNILGLTKNRIYGRKCTIVELSYSACKLFLDDNHLQGNTNASVRLGLKYNNEIVSVMCFNKPRLSIGGKYDGYELSRFSSKLNTTVIGGADKLLKYFVSKYNPKQIISYADRRWSNGDLYQKLGFIEKNINQPNFWYIIGKTRKHRMTFNKINLSKLGYDTTSKTEHEIMLSRGIYRIYDCGTIAYIKYY